MQLKVYFEIEKRKMFIKVNFKADFLIKDVEDACKVEAMKWLTFRNETFYAHHHIKLQIKNVKEIKFLAWVFLSKILERNSSSQSTSNFKPGWLIIQIIFVATTCRWEKGLNTSLAGFNSMNCVLCVSLWGLTKCINMFKLTKFSFKTNKAFHELTKWT